MNRILIRNLKIAAAMLFVVFAAHGVADAQPGGKIVSGNYGSLILGIDPEGNLTGYFSEATGDDGRGNPRFTCMFFLHGEKQSDGVIDVATWYPEYPGDVINGQITYVDDRGKGSVNLRLHGEHGGCWNVLPHLKDDKGVDFELDSTGAWESVRVIQPERVYLFKSAEAAAPQKIYVVKNDVVSVLRTKGYRAEISFINAAGRETKGWMNAADFYPLSRDK